MFLPHSETECIVLAREPRVAPLNLARARLRLTLGYSPRPRNGVVIYPPPPPIGISEWNAPSGAAPQHWLTCDNPPGYGIVGVSRRQIS